MNLKKHVKLQKTRVLPKPALITLVVGFVRTKAILPVATFDMFHPQ